MADEAPATSFERLTLLAGDFAPGMVCLVGAGPGDSTLVSVRGAVRLAQADVVLHDRLVGPELLDLASRAEKIFVGKWRGEHVWTQDQINAALVQHARAGLRVVRLKGGDPFVFGRGGEECEHLRREEIPYEVVPGITAAFGAPAFAGIPLTHRGLSRSFGLATAHGEPGTGEEPDYAALARLDTVALYMGLKHLRHTCKRLVEAGMDADTPAAVIEWGTRPQQRTIVGTLCNLAEHVEPVSVRPPALVLIGRVVELRPRIEWFESRPLHGQRILVTRARDQAPALSSRLAALGAEVIESPTLEVADAEDTAPMDAALRHVGRYAFLVLTSANGVDAMFRRLDALGLDCRALAGPRIAAIGAATAERLATRGIRADLVPGEAVGEAMAAALLRAGAAGQQVLLLRGDMARGQLTDALQAAGAACDDIIAYRNVRPAALSANVLERLDRGELDWITLTSPSSLHHLLDLLGSERAARLRTIRLASIGPVTSRAIGEAGLAVAAQADPHDVPGLVEAIRRAVSSEA